MAAIGKTIYNVEPLPELDVVTFAFDFGGIQSSITNPSHLLSIKSLSPWFPVFRVWLKWLVVDTSLDCMCAIITGSGRWAASASINRSCERI